MKLHKSLVMYALMAFFTVHVTAQDLYKLETPYEEARAKLAEEAVAKISQNNLQLTMTIALSEIKMQEEEWSEWQQLVYYETIIALYWGSYQWEEPKTYNDFRTFQRVGPACEEYARKRNELEQTKTPLDIERERIRNYRPPVGALSTVMTNVRKSFMKQMKKGEYEKLAQFRQRIKETGPHIFDSIAHQHCIALLAEFKLRQKYDVENEIDSIFVWYHEDNKMLGTCSMSPEVAQRKIWQKQPKDISGKNIKMCVVNGEILPYKITLSSDNEQWQYVFHPLAKGTVMDTNIVFSVAQTGITDTIILQMMGSHVFNCNQITEQKIMELERKKQVENLAERLYKATLYYKPEITKRKNNFSYFPTSVAQEVLLSISNDFEKKTGENIYECYSWLYSITQQCKEFRGISDFVNYINKNHLEETDIEKFIENKRQLKEHNEYISEFDLLDEIDRVIFLNHFNLGKSGFSIEINKREIVSQMNKLKDSDHVAAYRILAQWIVENDKKISKEWKKNKDKYPDVIEFYEYYVSKSN